MASQLRIPNHDKYHPKEYSELPQVFKDSLSEEYFPMMRKISTSFFGQIVKVWYVLRVTIKHDSWLEWGDGASVDFPIKILPRPIEVVD